MVNVNVAHCVTSKRLYQLKTNELKTNLDLIFQFFFENWASSLFFDLLKTSFMQKISEHNSERTSGRTDGRTDMGESIGPTSEVGGSNNLLFISNCPISNCRWEGVN